MKKVVLIALCLMSAHCLLCGTGIIDLQNIRYYTYPEYTRVVLDLSAPLEVDEKVLPGAVKTRIYFDMDDCRFAPGYPKDKKKKIIVQKGHLQQIRIAQKGELQIRVVFDFDTIDRHTKFYLTSPYRVVFDVFQKKQQRGSTTEVDDEPSRKTDKKEETTVHKQGKTGNTEPVVIHKPPLKEGKNYSIVRQLGLGVRTIVIDPGHGGRDPGTCNRRLGVQEKRITLDIAKRLKRLFRKLNPEYNIILTRETDRYISLEERTAIANSKNGDLFISIHLNSAPRRSARGVETYFLSMTTDAWAMQVAAQENAMSRKSIGDMNDIVEQIVKHARVSESRVFTRYIQQQLVLRLRKKYNNIKDLGVKKAPFFVLAGAGMPATLVEVSFLSNTSEGKRLKSPAYRYAIAAGLYRGIIAYIKSLGKK